MASSSSSPQARSIVSPKLYDVFISHRGPDVKETLAKQLYDLLKARQCKAFLDREEFEGGDSVTAGIHNAICSSRVQVAIFSPRYAESSWCLDELVLMLQQPDAIFIPVFYDVEPSELRYIDDSKKESPYAAAFSKYRSKGRNLDKLEEWRKALASAADIIGYKFSQHKDNLCEEIVSRVVQVVKEKEKSIPLHVANHPVGLGELGQDFERYCSNTAGMVGIFGLGGSGKTTLAKELFNKKCSGYGASCFLSDVRESHANGDLKSLQKQLLEDLFGKNEEIRSVDDGIGKLKNHLARAKYLNFLVILDDIDHEDQLNALLPKDVLGSGSLVIITTRDQIVLRDADVHYKMKNMGKDQAKELFCSHAFHRRDPPTAYEELVESFVEYCGGLPLSLIVLGAHVYRRDEHYWNLALEKARKIQPEDIMKRLKISFDGLDREEKQIFIDIACLFNKKKDYDLISNAITIWNAANWSAEHALQTLQDRCLVEVVNKRVFEMHDHVRDLGRQMADELGPPRIWRSDILRSMEAKGFQRILEETKGRCFHSFMDSSLGRQITYFIADTDLLWLAIAGGYVDLTSIPSWIPLLKLHSLKVCEVKELWSSFQQQLQANTQATSELRKLRIWDCLHKPPYCMEMLNHLEELEIKDSLKKADTTSLVQSLKQLSNLRSLDMWYPIDGLMWYPIDGLMSDLRKGRDSINLDSSTSSCLRRLETIRLVDLETISNLVISGEMCPKLRSLFVSGLQYLFEMELEQLQSLNTLTVCFCRKLETVPWLSSLTGLQSLRVEYCDALENLSGLSSLTGLQSLKVEYCDALENLSGLSSLTELRKVTVKGLKSLSTFAHLRRLEEITIVDCPELQSVEGVDELPELKNLVIQMPDAGYTDGLRLSVKKTILTQKEAGGVSAKLNANLFSEVVGAEAVSEIQRQEYVYIGHHQECVDIGDHHSDYEYEPLPSLKIESSPSTITIYALLVTAESSDLSFEGDVFCGHANEWNLYIVTFLLTQHDSGGIMWNARVEKGFKVTVKAEEEGKALTVLQRIIDRLYTKRTVPNLAA